MKKYFLVALFFILLSVVLGALGAHALKNILNVSLLETFKTGVQYQMYNGLGLLGLVNYWERHSFNSSKPLLIIILGTLLFSFGCYFYAFSGIKFFVHIVPVGGVLMMIGWLLSFCFIVKNK